MSKIYDYTSFSSGKTGFNRGKYNFGYDFKYIDIDIFGRPEEYENISDAKVFLEYSVDLNIDKNGISGLNFSVSGAELEFGVDDYPNPPKEFDIDLIPGKTIDVGQFKIDVTDNPIPTYPTRIEINMNRSTDCKKFDVLVVFGS